MLNNPHDDLGADPDWTDDDKKSFEKLDYLIHKVFSQTDEGVELLEKWKEGLMMSPGAEPGSGMLEIGLTEGTKTFIRNIKLNNKEGGR